MIWYYYCGNIHIIGNYSINAAGIRSGMFDSIFFGVRAALSQDGTLLSPPVVYAVSAISAASADYLVDVAVKRMMKVPPNYPVPGILDLLKGMIKSERIFDLHRGLASKVFLPSNIGLLRLILYNRPQKWALAMQ